MQDLGKVELHAWFTKCIEIPILIIWSMQSQEGKQIIIGYMVILVSYKTKSYYLVNYLWSGFIWKSVLFPI